MRELANRRIGPMVEEPLLQLGLVAARAYIHRHPVSTEIWPTEIRDVTRQEIDELVLRLIGVSPGDVLSVRTSIYNELISYTRRLRILELEAQLNRQGRPTVKATSIAALADDVWASLIESQGVEPKAIPEEFLLPSDRLKVIEIPAAAKLQMARANLFDEGATLIGRIGKKEIRFSSQEEAEYIGYLAERGFTGEVAVPERPDAVPRSEATG